MKRTTLTEAHPWTQPWWHASGGNLWVLLYIVAIHVTAVIGLILFPIPSGRTIAAALAIACLGGVGTSVCYHRTLAHKALRLNPVLEQILIFFAVFNGSGAPQQWTANHRQHHASSDTLDDVSSPRHGGFWWAHLRWLYQWPGSDIARWCRDLNRSRYGIWEKLQIPIVMLSMTSGLLLGWQGFFWIGAIRLVYSLHFQCFVNSLLHMSPDIPLGEDSSRNVWWLGPLQLTAWGENWHWNHHNDSNSARFGRDWWQIDLGWYIIRILSVFQLASHIRTPRPLSAKMDTSPV